jgi:hypothetical protein
MSYKLRIPTEGDYLGENETVFGLKMLPFRELAVTGIDKSFIRGNLPLFPVCK